MSMNEETITISVFRWRDIQIIIDAVAYETSLAACSHCKNMEYAHMRLNMPALRRELARRKKEQQA